MLSARPIRATSCTGFTVSRTRRSLHHFCCCSIAWGVGSFLARAPCRHAERRAHVVGTPSCRGRERSGESRGFFPTGYCTWVGQAAAEALTWVQEGTIIPPSMVSASCKAQMGWFGLLRAQLHEPVDSETALLPATTCNPGREAACERGIQLAARATLAGCWPLDEHHDKRAMIPLMI